MGLTRPSYGSYQYPDWAVAVAWMAPLLSMIQIPIHALVGLIKEKGDILQVGNRPWKSLLSQMAAFNAVEYKKLDIFISKTS